MKTHKLSSYDVDGMCDDCDFEASSKNAHGLAAQHHYRTGHTVHIEVVRGYTMTKEDSDWYKSWKKLKNTA